MQKISSDSIKRLLQVCATPAVTIYLPTHKNANRAAAREDARRFKNLATEAGRQLRLRPATAAFAAEFEAACAQLDHDQEFWARGTESLLVCAAPGQFEQFNLPVDSDEHLTVAEQYYLSPILGLIDSLGEYYLLKVGLSEPALFKADSYGLSSVAVKLPDSIDTTLIIGDDRFTSKRPEGNQAHRPNSGRRDYAADQMHFFKLIDAIVCHSVDRQLPLILAGIEHEVAEYRGYSRHPRLLPDSVEGRHHDLALLHAKAQAIMQRAVIAPAHQMALADYSRALGRTPAMALTSRWQLDTAAASGRIDTLLIAMTSRTRSGLRSGASAVRKIVFPDREDSLLIDRIASQVARQSGRVINLLQDEMPHGKLMLATARY